MLKKKSKLRIAVTGSEGLIGKEVCRLFKRKKLNFLRIDKKNNLNIESPKTIAFLRKNRINNIVHCASHPGGLSNKFPKDNVKINCYGTMNILNYCKENNCRIIFTSSSAVYGEINSRNITEKSSMKPGTIYAVNKIAVENWIKILSKIYKFDWTILRLFPTYGSGHKLNTYQGIVNVMLTQILKSKKIIVHGSLNRQRDLVYCEDAALAIFKTLYSKRSNKKILNVCSGQITTVKDIINNIFNILDYSKNNYDIIVKEKLPGDTFSLIGNPNLARKIIDFKTQFSFEAGLKHMLSK